MIAHDFTRQVRARKLNTQQLNGAASCRRGALSDDQSLIKSRRRYILSGRRSRNKPFVALLCIYIFIKRLAASQAAQISRHVGVMQSSCDICERDGSLFSEDVPFFRISAGQ